MGLLRRYCSAWSRHHRSAGFGIHSPHAYRFVTEVLGERRPYYAYSDIAELRRRVIAALGSTWPHSGVMPLKQAQLLLRVINHFNPPRILQVGATTGMSSAVMLAVNSRSHLWLHERRLDKRPVARQVMAPLSARIDHGTELAVVVEAYTQALDGALPFVVVNHIDSQADATTLGDSLRSLMAGRRAVLLMSHIDHEYQRHVWDTACQALESGQTFANGRRAILVADPKLQREHFDLWL